MLKPHGCSVITDPGARRLKTENDVVTCVHCGHIDMVRNKTSGNLEVMIYRPDGSFYFREAGWCRSCADPICPRCRPCSRENSMNRFHRLDADEKAARKFVCF